MKLYTTIISPFMFGNWILRATNDINIENRIQEASVKRQQFKDAEYLLLEKGFTLGSKEVISYPTISNNRCLIIEEDEVCYYLI